MCIKILDESYIVLSSAGNGLCFPKACSLPRVSFARQFFMQTKRIPEFWQFSEILVQSSKKRAYFSGLPASSSLAVVQFRAFLTYALAQSHPTLPGSCYRSRVPERSLNMIERPKANIQYPINWIVLYCGKICEYVA